MAMPSETRPHRPERWLAEAWDTRSIGSRWTLVRWRIAGDAGGACVNDVLDARNGQRRLGHVGGQHDPALAARVEHLVLFLKAEPGEEWQDLGPGQAPVGLDPCVECLCRVTDLALAGEEDEDVAGGLGGKFVDGVADRV